MDEASARNRKTYLNTLWEKNTMPEANALLKMVTNRLDQEKFRQQHWDGSFHDYLEIVTKNPKVCAHHAAFVPRLRHADSVVWL